MPKNVKKVLHICIIITIIVAIGFTALMFILRYIENGETNLPFEISKITVVSTVDAKTVEDSTNKWNEIVSQNNDIFIDIKKNENYSKNRIIESITIDNFEVVQKPLKGDITVYKPSTNQVKTFENIDSFRVSEIVYEGNKENDLQNLKVANQGGRFAFRCANNNVGTYISNDEDELNYNELLGKMGITDEELYSSITFDAKIMLTNGTGYTTTMKVDFPISGICQDGKSSKEITDFDFIFKRLEN